MKSFCQDALTTAKPGQFWRKMRPLLPKTRCNKNKGYVFIEKEKVITDPKEIAETFNNYFAMLNKSGGDNMDIEDFSDHLRLVYRELPTTNLLKRFHSRPLMPTIYGIY